MSAFDEIKTCFDRALARFEKRRPIRTLLNGDATAAQYCAILREIYFHTRENPQIQALATVRFRGDQRQNVKRFFQHATAEIGHDQLALNDLQAMGQDVSMLPSLNPAPATAGLTAYGFYTSWHLNPVAYLGYLFFLEFMPTSSGERYAKELAKAGVPQEAMSFLLEHAHVDVAHNRLMMQYINSLVWREEDIQSVKYAIRATGDLYAAMLDQAMFDEGGSEGWGAAPDEYCFLRSA